MEPEEIEYFRRLKLSDVVRATTTIGDKDVQGWMGSSVEFISFKIGFEPDFTQFERIYE